MKVGGTARSVATMGSLCANIRMLEDNFVAGIWRQVLEDSGPFAALGEVLSQWAAADPRPPGLLTMGDRL